MLIAGTWATQHPQQIEAIIPIALAIVGSIGAFIPDKRQSDIAQDSKDYKKSVSDAQVLSKNESLEKSEENSDTPSSSGWGDK
jgi:hypothetical protein